MVLLARRALQERFATAARDDVGGEGIEPGCYVCVLGGRHFPSFTAGDAGEVIRVDHEALNCEVLFDGASEPVPVALRHLKLLSPPQQRTATGALRNTPTSARNVPEIRGLPRDANGNAGLWKASTADPGGPSSASTADPCTSREVSVSQPSDAAEEVPSATGLEESLLSGTVRCAGASGHGGERAFLSNLVRDVEAQLKSNMQPEERQGRGEEPPCSPLESQNRALSRIERKLFVCEASMDARTKSSDGGLQATGAGIASDKLQLNGSTVETLEARLELLEERHQAELTSLRSALEEAVAFGRQQEARANALEQRLIALGAGVGPESPSQDLKAAGPAQSLMIPSLAGGLGGRQFLAADISIGRPLSARAARAAAAAASAAAAAAAAAADVMQRATADGCSKSPAADGSDGVTAQQSPSPNSRKGPPLTSNGQLGSPKRSDDKSPAAVEVFLDGSRRRALSASAPIGARHRTSSVPGTGGPGTPRQNFLVAKPALAVTRQPSQPSVATMPLVATTAVHSAGTLSPRPTVPSLLPSNLQAPATSSSTVPRWANSAVSTLAGQPSPGISQRASSPSPAALHSGYVPPGLTPANTAPTLRGGWQVTHSPTGAIGSAGVLSGLAIGGRSLNSLPNGSTSLTARNSTASGLQTVPSFGNFDTSWSPRKG
eukprot:gnl/TRDRNA2_/TRDRNA2_129978_c0_seq1.p1 gnl/TRDRNA2_/TRDRNA2_129978_c0~~gnl/TRDRNA2_/TRDRNA2_129978_c0_seq1.p1  ORF type:complete len:665 (-),score=116.32 gnl/TRDRNA2_/TRDRNA2_129978_c0_seq1:67-2061(-)